MVQTMKTAYSNELQTGDFIIISNGRFLALGFYLGRGSTGSLQFYSLWSLSTWLDKTNRVKSPHKEYVNIAGQYRVAKYHPDCLENPEFIEKYEKAVEALKLLKII